MSATSTATATAGPAVRAKEFHFPLAIDWVGERRVLTSRS